MLINVILGCVGSIGSLAPGGRLATNGVSSQTRNLHGVACSTTHVFSCGYAGPWGRRWLGKLNWNVYPGRTSSSKSDAKDAGSRSMRRASVPKVRAIRPPAAGMDCESPHEPPHLAHGSICNGPLCKQWLDQHAVTGGCVNQHAHEAHFDCESRSGTYHSCSGRQYCDPSFMEPSDVG
jgi:hypothetical protein